MKNYILFLCALVTIGFASSCKSPTDFDTDRWNDKDTTTYPAPQELAGEWYLAYYETFGGMPDSVPNQMYMVNFETSKKVSGKVNCNTLAGEYTAVTTTIGNTPDKALTFKNISTTKMNCGTGDLDAKFVAALNASKQYYAFGSMLEITYTVSGTTQSQRMIFTRKQAPNNNFDLLKGSEWTLVSFEIFGVNPDWIPVSEQANLNISFLGDSIAKGMAQCGSFGAKYRTSNIKIANTPDYPLNFTIIQNPNCGAGSYGGRFLEGLTAAKQYYQFGDSLEITYTIGLQGGVPARMMFVRKGSNWNPQDTLTRVKTTMVSQLPNANVPSDQFVITKRYSSDTNGIKIGVQYSGGCALHEFELFGKVTLNGVEALLTHDANNDPCDALLETPITLDISKFIEEYKKLSGKSSSSFYLILRSTGNSEVYTYVIQY